MSNKIEAFLNKLGAVATIGACIEAVWKIWEYDRLSGNSHEWGAFGVLIFSCAEAARARWNRKTAGIGTS